MSKKVILFYPRHTTGWEAQPWCDIPLGLLCVATPLVNAGYKVKIIDQRIEPEWRRLLLQEFKDNPLCLGLSTTTGPQLQYALEVSRIAKKCADLPVVWGGVHPSLLPEQTLQNDCVDIVVQGEGEETFLDLVQALDGRGHLSKVKGIWYKENSGIRRTEERPFINLDVQPPLAWDLLEPRKYVRKVFGVERLSFCTSRGCPFTCAFCFNPVFNKRRWRGMNPDLAAQRIKEVVEKYKIKGIFLTDGNFFTDINWARRVLEAIVRANLDIVITRLHICVDSLDRLNDEDLVLLEKAGCRCLSIGVESGSERIRGLLNKPIDVTRLLEINRRLRRYPFFPLYFFMVGFPTETKSEIAETVSLFTRLLRENPNASKSVNIYTPFPGTELFGLAVRCGLEVPQRTEEWVGFNYRNAASRSRWLNRETRGIIEMIDFCSMFVDKNALLASYKQTNRLTGFLTSLYAPIARTRLDHLWYSFPLEIRLAKLLRLYAKQS